MKYTVKKFDTIRGCWVYFNSFNDYKEAADARDNLQRRFKGRFEVFQNEED